MPDPAPPVTPECPHCARQRELTRAIQARYAKRDRHAVEDVALREGNLQDAIAYWRRRAIGTTLRAEEAERLLEIALYAVLHDGELAMLALDALANSVRHAQDAPGSPQRTSGTSDVRPDAARPT